MVSRTETLVFSIDPYMGQETYYTLDIFAVMIRFAFSFISLREWVDVAKTLNISAWDLRDEIVEDLLTVVSVSYEPTYVYDYATRKEDNSIDWRVTFTYDEEDVEDIITRHGLTYSKSAC